MKPLSPQARRLFELSRDEPGPDGPARIRVARALVARMASDAGAATAGVSAAVGNGLAPAAGKAAGLTTIVKSVLVASAGVVATVGWLTLHPPRQQARRDSVRSAEQATAEYSAVDGEPPTPLPTLPSAKAPGPPSPRRSAAGSSLRLPRESTRPERMPRPLPDPPGAREPELRHPWADSAPGSAAHAESPSRISSFGDPLRAETDGLRMAQQALRDDKPRLALELLQAQDLHFPDGALEQERFAARVLALCQAGLVAEARTQAVRFEQRWPRSPLKSRVRSACLR
jgi:hypothetical protein